MAQTTQTNPEETGSESSFGGGVPALLRHPKDDWQLADPCRLSKGGMRRLRGLLKVFLPATSPAPPFTPDLEDRIVDQLLRLIQYMHPMIRLGIRLSMWLVDWAPRWRLRSWRRLTKLDRERADKLLDQLGLSRLPIVRTTVFIVRGLVLSAYYDQPEVHQAINYEPIPFIKSRIELRNRLLDGSIEADADRIGPYSEVARCS